MKQIDKIKKDISEISEPFELAGYLDGITAAAAIYCKKEYPDEVIFKNGKLQEITIYGMGYYLDNEAE